MEAEAIGQDMANDQLDTDIPKIVLEQEDREAYRRSRMQQSKGSASTAKPDSKPEKPASGGFPTLAFFAFLVAAGASAASYWLYEQTRQQSLSLQNAEQRIKELERRLSATGEEMDQSAVALQVKVTELTERSEELWDQMDKLWASAWRRNQSEIKDLRSGLAKAAKTSDGKLSSIQADLAQSSTSLTVLEEQLNAQAQETTALEAQIAQLGKTDDGVQRQFGDMEAKLIALDQVNSALTRRVAELEKQNRELKRTVTSTVPPPSSQGTTTTTGTPQG